MNKDKTIYLIDGSAYIYRAYHAIQSLSNSKGFPTNAIFGFTRMLLKLINEQRPEYIVMFFDSKWPTFRHDMFDAYKANRPPMPEDLSVQIPYIKEITSAFNLPVIEKQGFEADDLIGTVSLEAEAEGFRVVMVTGDKDFMQLVTDKAVIWDPMKDKTIDADSIRKDFGVYPNQMTDVFGLAGDSADNIPGVPGIGQKTALSLIKDFGSMDLLYEKIDTITKKKQKENLIKYKDQAFLSKDLVTIDTHAPISLDLDQLKYTSFDNVKLSELFKELEFSQLQKAFFKQAEDLEKKYQTVLSVEELSGLVAYLEAAPEFAVDTETTSVNPMKARIVGISFSVKQNKASYIPCGHAYEGAPEQLDLDLVLKCLKPVLENPEIKKIGQNIKYDLMVFARHGIHLSGVFFDTMLASYLINPSRRAHNLEQIALDFLDYKMISYKEVTHAGTQNKVSCFSEVPVDKASYYSCEDADITFSAYRVLLPILKETQLYGLLKDVEIPLVPVLMDMELNGICVDKLKLKVLSESFGKQLESLESRIYDIAGETFNIKSSQQLGQILFEKLGLPVQKKTKKTKSYSTDVDVLSKLSSLHELPQVVLRHRTLAKLKSTYTDALIELINPETGRLHTSFNQTVTVTGRLSSSDPNLQNIPVRGEEGKQIRTAFIPRPGWVLLSADYSQIELRILAHYSDDPIFIKAFLDDEDIHTRTATEVFQVFPSFITPELRRQAKAINFGIIYGMGAFRLSQDLDISRKMAQAYINNYFERYKGIKRYIDETIETARQTQQTSTLLGRVRFLPDINSSNKTMREFAERTAINTPIQGTAADLIKIAMINIHRAFHEKKLSASMLLSVHDELIFEVSADELDTVSKLVRNIMENVWELKVPLKVNVETGENWAEAH
jgi:DNA polymerase-1